LSFAATAQTKSSATISKKNQAITLLRNTTIQKSSYWPSVDSALFLQNLQRNIEQPVFLYAGRNTNFCGFAAVGYIILKEDPLGYVQFMINLYKHGKATYADVTYRPAISVRTAAGTILFEGELDRNDADQIFFFTMADHYKGYINLFHVNYKPGRELGFWAATNLSKFNRMLRATLQTDIQCIGYDLTRVKIKELTTFLQSKINKGDVFLYVNNSVLRRKNHSKIKKQFPTHFIVLQSITEENGMLTLTYWDAGFTTKRQVEIKSLKGILFGISWSLRKS
jgi:hypothetical protein